MNTETHELKKSVRQGYQILLRAAATLILPTEYEEIAAYYRSLADTCMTWALEVYGSRLTEQFETLTTLSEKARFSTVDYRFSMKYTWENTEMAAIVCESLLLHQPTAPVNSYHRLSHVWKLSEQTILPRRQIEEAFGFRLGKKDLPFVPDGMYPDGERFVFFKNPRGESPFEETHRVFEEKFPTNGMI